jgi:hypothetical protein
MIVAKRVISQLARNKDICPKDFFKDHRTEFEDKV